MSHLTDDQILAAAPLDAARQGEHGEHLRNCQDCRVRVAAMANLASAGRVLAAESMADMPVPAFDRIRTALPDRAPEPERRPSPLEHLRLAGALVFAQLRLLPSALLPVSLIGFAAAVLLAVSLPAGRLGEQAFGAIVVLVVLTGALSTYSNRRDPRAEPLFTMPVSPMTVFGCRVVGVLGVDLVLAVLCSVLVRVLGGSDSLADTVASWFGQALLTSGIALAVAVGRSPLLGAVLGLLTWALGSASVLPGLPDVPLRPAFSVLWTTSPGVLLLALALVALAILRMRVPSAATTTRTE